MRPAKEELAWDSTPPPLDVFDSPETTVSQGPPLPERGLPEGWTMEQWNHYGAQWLAQQAEAPPAPAPNPGVENPFSAPTSAEDDLDLDF